MTTAELEAIDAIHDRHETLQAELQMRIEKLRSALSNVTIRATIARRHANTSERYTALDSRRLSQAIRKANAVLSSEYHAPTC